MSLVKAAVLILIVFTRQSYNLPVFSVIRSSLPNSGPQSTRVNFSDVVAVNAARDVDAKWPAFSWDSPANYHNYGKWFNDNWVTPENVPHWYNQPDGGFILKGSAGFLKPHFYGPDPVTVQQHQKP